MRNFFLWVLLGMLAGCTRTPPSDYSWSKDGSSQQDFNRDRYACLQESQQGAATGAYTQYGGRSRAYVRTNYTLYNACMAARGWELTVVTAPRSPDRWLFGVCLTCQELKPEQNEQSMPKEAPQK
jgi:hypothetical protein